MREIDKKLRKLQKQTQKDSQEALQEAQQHRKKPFGKSSNPRNSNISKLDLKESKNIIKMVGHYCAVPHCHNQVSRDPVRFFKIIRKNEKQTNLWIKAINRLESDGTPWKPKDKSTICSAHFVGDSFSKDPNDIDYVPTLFLTKNSSETFTQKSRNFKKSNNVKRIVIKKEGEKFVEIRKPHMMMEEEEAKHEDEEYLPIKVEMPENLEIDENLDPSRYVDSELIDTNIEEEEEGTHDLTVKTSPIGFLGKEALNFDVCMHF